MSEPPAVPLRRRGLVAAAAGLLAGLLAKTTGRAEAQSNPSLTLNQTNNSTGATELRYNGTPANAPTLLVRNPSFDAIQGVASGSLSYGVLGDNAAGFGVVGTSNTGVGVSGGASGNGVGVSGDSVTGTGVAGFSDNGYGVYGNATAPAGNGSGVRGDAPASSGSGVRGDSPSGIGVRGNSGTNSTAPLIGVFGVADPNASTTALPGQPAGVYGISNSTLSVAGVVGQANAGLGVYGASSGNVGVLGTSTARHGLYGSSTNGFGLYATSTNSTGIVASTNSGNAIQGAANSNVGVLGTSNSSIGGYFSSSTSTGLYATGPAAGFAARFDGPVLVTGNFTAIGGSKSAAVPVADGSYRLLYCVESPESWFEDFGSATLTGGRATVQLPSDFAAIVLTENYRVFLTPNGSSNGLYVSSKTPTGFVVQEQNNGTSNVGFDYRIVAKRKDITAARLAPVTIPPAPPPPPVPPPPPIPPLGTAQAAPGGATAADSRNQPPAPPPPPAPPTRRPSR